jgi:hypothetical protein
MNNVVAVLPLCYHVLSKHCGEQGFTAASPKQLQQPGDHAETTEGENKVGNKSRGG